MKFSYEKLFRLLKDNGLKRTDLLEVTNNKTLARLGKDEVISTDTLIKICNFLQCQPAEIMEYVNDDGTIPYKDKLLEAQNGNPNIPNDFFKEAKEKAEKNPNKATEIYGEKILEVISKTLGMPFEEYIKEIAKEED